MDINNYDSNEIINLLERFLNVANINKKLKGICALTIAKDRGTLCSCFIFDYDTKNLLKHYPGRYPSNNPIYKTIGNERFTINLGIDLVPKSENGRHRGIEDANYMPFCCGNCRRNNRGRLTNDSDFNNFKNKTGNSNYIFKVTKKIQYGPLESIKFYTLNNGKIIEKGFMENTFKKNTFRIYTCDRHNTYYSVDLHTTRNEYTQHHSKGQHETFFGPLMINLILNAI